MIMKIIYLKIDMSDYTPKIETLIKNAVEPHKKRDRDLGKMIGQS